MLLLYDYGVRIICAPAPGAAWLSTYVRSYSGSGSGSGSDISCCCDAIDRLTTASGHLDHLDSTDRPAAAPPVRSRKLAL